MEQNKISRRNFLRVAGASATAAAMSGLVPAASAAGIKDLWSMDLQILATSDTQDRKSTRLNSSHASKSRMPSSA